MSDILEFFHEEKYKQSETTYEELRKKNSSSFEMHNPLTKEEELKRHF